MAIFSMQKDELSSSSVIWEKNISKFTRLCVYVRVYVQTQRALQPPLWGPQKGGVGGAGGREFLFFVLLSLTVVSL